MINSVLTRKFLIEKELHEELKSKFVGDRETQAKKEWLSKSESNVSVNKKMNEIKNVLRNTLSETMKNHELSKL